MSVETSNSAMLAASSIACPTVLLGPVSGTSRATLALPLVTVWIGVGASACWTGAAGKGAAVGGGAVTMGCGRCSGAGTARQLGCERNTQGGAQDDCAKGKPGHAISGGGERAEGSEPPRTSKSTLLPGTLVIVATPIGNLGDMTRRAVDSLTDAAVIACEDTRVTAKLLSAYGIKTPMLAYHEHNAARMRPLLIDRLKQGEIVALVSDAGTPLVSDPGYKLVEAAIAEDIPVTAAPGASALLTALVLSGLPSDRFLFAGFLPPKSPARRTEIRTLAAVPATLIFYEAPQRLAKALEDLGRHARGPSRRGGAGTDQAVRGDSARYARPALPRITVRRSSPRVNSSSWSARPAMP